jgi:primosomal protein N' (replication factor Y)
MAAPDDQQLGLGLDVPTSPVRSAARPRGDQATPTGRVVRVQPDVVGIPKRFDYVVPNGTHVEVGDVVRVRLGARPVRGWVVALDVEVDPEVHLQRVTKVSGRGPTAELIDLADWAAWRWAGRAVHLLRTATPPTNVDLLPPAQPTPTPAAEAVTGRSSNDAADLRAALDDALAVLPLGPAEDRYPIARAAAAVTSGHALLLCPSAADATALAARLERDGVPVALLAGQEPAGALSRQWARARAGCTVVGTRAAAWAPLPEIGRVVVFDEHDEAYQGDQTPTWNARDVAIERARRAGAPCLLVSPTPSLDALEVATLVERSRATQRSGWPRFEVVDQRDLDPATGPLFSPRVVQLVRGEGRVLCILNRTGRVRLLACGACSTIARCATCDGPVSLEDDGGTEVLVCARDDHRRPPVCLECGGSRFKNLRLGVGRAREELEVLAGRPVGEVTGASDAIPDAQVLIGTEALLHRVARADSIVFLDADQHLLAIRFRAGEQALGLFARAARIVARGRGGRVVVQTRNPDHPALVAAADADPLRFAEPELAVRRVLGLPPVTAMALVSGAGAPAFVASLGAGERLTVQGPVDGVWRFCAPDHDHLADALAAIPRPEARLRIEVDPLGA